MGTYIKAGVTGDFQNMSKKKVDLQGKEIMVARIGDTYYAIDNRCPHMGGDLSQGKLEGTVVTCPRHSSQIDVTDGRVIRWMSGTGFAAAVGKIAKPPRPVQAYKVKVEGDAIMVEV
jgi:3-phenylpropionate/trans-cinnamate dioxygenase ferredoxin component